MKNVLGENFLTWDLATLSEKIAGKQISPVEVTRELLNRIETMNPKLNAFITILREEALEDAKKVEQEIIAGYLRGPLHGIPIGLKDLISTKNIRTTMGSEIYKDFMPDYDATVVDKLKQAGAILIGKLNTHQFAYGPTGDRSYFGPVKNPYNHFKIAGGSSSGSAAAVAAGLCFGALGTDTGGSVRVPASCCGIVGMKPTFGRVSKHGVYPLAWTLDHVGVMTRTVRDNALMLGVLSGYDGRDPYSVQKNTENFEISLAQGIKASKLGIPKSYYFETMQPEVRRKLLEAIELFRKLGVEIHEVELKGILDTTSAHRITISSEAYTVHAERLKSHKEGWDDEVRERLFTGEPLRAYEYVLAQQVKNRAVEEFNCVLKEVDVILTPTLQILPTEIGQREVEIEGNKQHVGATLTRLTCPTNLTGHPSLSIPCGFSETGLPIGLQLIGKPFKESDLYRFGYAFEQVSSVPTLKFDID